MNGFSERVDMVKMTKGMGWGGFFALISLSLVGCANQLLLPQEKEAKALVGHPIEDAYKQFGNETTEGPAQLGSQKHTAHVWRGMPLQTTSQVFVQTGSQMVGMTEGGNGVASAPVEQSTGYYVAQKDSVDIFLYTNSDNVIIRWDSHRNWVLQ
jgi:hypothetical protein